MSILSDVIAKRITWSQAASEVAGWATSLIAHNPAAQALVGQALSEAKQMVSNGIEMADTALAAHSASLAKAAETALEAELAAITKGVSLPFNPFISDGIDKLASSISAAAHLWALEAKAKLAAAPDQSNGPAA